MTSSFCLNCIKDNRIKNLVKSEGKIINQCKICGSKKVHALNSNNYKLKSRIRALIRFHFSEWHYNGHLGGDPLETLFFTDNPITNYSSNWNSDLYEDAIFEIIEPAYEPYDKGISLFSGYTDGFQNKPLLAIKYDKSSKITQLIKLVKEKNYFLIEKNARTDISRLIEDYDETLPKGKKLYRTRLGYADRASPMQGIENEQHFKPYTDDQLSSPSPIDAISGRMNRAGVSFLYLSTDKQTAISETRPHPGQYCSYGKFIALNNLRIADLTSIHITDFANSDKRLDDFLFLNSINELFSIPVIPTEKAIYHTTQLLADCFRQLGFDAVHYKSSVGLGSNYVVFDPDNFAFVKKSASVVKITELIYNYNQMQLITKTNDYWTNSDGSYI